MPRPSHIVMLIFTVLAAGCASVQWHKPGASSADLARDLDACRHEAQAQSFQALQARAAARPYGSGYDVLGRDTLAPRMSDESDRVMIEHRLLRECMQHRGYEPETASRR